MAEESRHHGVPRLEVQGLHIRNTRKVELPRNISERLPAQAGPSQHGLPHWEDGVCTGFQSRRQEKKAEKCPDSGRMSVARDHALRQLVQAKAKSEENKPSWFASISSETNATKATSVSTNMRRSEGFQASEH